jgi:hypothetical protein
MDALAELARLRRDARPGADALVLRRAEIAAETAIAAAAVTSTPPRLSGGSAPGPAQAPSAPSGTRP